MNLTPMDLVRGAIANAIAEGLDIVDLWAASEHAETPEDFDRAVNLLVTSLPDQGGAVWVNGAWVEIK